MWVGPQLCFSSRSWLVVVVVDCLFLVLFHAFSVLETVAQVACTVCIALLSREPVILHCLLFQRLVVSREVGFEKEIGVEKVVEKVA